MTNQSERINKIREQRKQLLSSVRDSIIFSNNSVSRSFSDVEWILSLYEKNSKKCEAIIKAQDFIQQLTIEIAECNDANKAIEIRKKLNYYIRKIKTELKNRGINDDFVQKYSDNVDNLRKNIAKYIRYLKRESNITEIEKLNNDVDNLSSEDREKLRKLLRNEVRYTANNMKANNLIPKKKEKVGMPSNKALDNIFLDENLPKRKEISEMYLEDKPVRRSNIADLSLEGVSSDLEFRDMSRKSLEDGIGLYDMKYHVYDLHEFEGSFSKRMAALLKNIPIYFKNKSRIKNMKQEVNMYYGGDDLIQYISYIEKINSIKYGLKKLFMGSKLYSKEAYYLKWNDIYEKLLRSCCGGSFLDYNYSRKKII